ncbi:MAG: GAF and ANTAR domain-containing protein [Actinomycetes bacterium]
MTDGPAPQELFSEIAEQLREGRTVEQVYQVIVDSAPRVIDGCDRAAIGILEGDRFRSAAATDEIMVLIDSLQNELNEGPCLEASTDQVWQLDNDLTNGSPWPRLAEQVLARTPVRGMLAVPLIDNGRRSGALNLFADRPDAFTEASTEAAAILAAFATVAISGAQESARAEQLAEGMATNREIGAAVGILMATHKISSEEAFAVLSRASQRLNRKLRDIAAGIVRGDAPPS